MSFAPADYAAILEELLRLGDPKYKAFNESLIPGTATAYGVRVPDIRAIARRVIRSDPRGFLAVSVPGSYEEIMLRGMVIAGMKLPAGERLPLIEGFLPLIDNWAVCDTFCGSLKLRSPEDMELMWRFIGPLFSDPREYHARFALVMFLGHFVDPDHISPGLAHIEALTQEQYYVRMAAAWAVSVCYVKFPAETMELLKRRTLPRFTQNKSIQKIRESYRVPKEDKEMLLQYKLT